MLTVGLSGSVRTRNDLVSILTEQIRRGDIAQAQLLPSERQLAEEFGLSRSMVREALRTLSERRLIEIIPGRGSVVIGTPLPDAVERAMTRFEHGGVTPRYLIEARSMIETTAAAQAARRASAADIERVWHAVNACNSANAVLDRVSMDLAFHLAVVRAAGNPLVEVMFRAIQPYIVEILLRSLTDAEVTLKGLVFHEHIARAIQAHNSVAAEVAMRDHLTLGLTLFGSDIDRDLKLVARDALHRLVNPSITVDDLLRLSREG